MSSVKNSVASSVVSSVGFKVVNREDFTEMAWQFVINSSDDARTVGGEVLAEHVAIAGAWLDRELYKHSKLTPEEFDIYIEDDMDGYYRDYVDALIDAYKLPSCVVVRCIDSSTPIECGSIYGIGTSVDDARKDTIKNFGFDPNDSDIAYDYCVLLNVSIEDASNADLDSYVSCLPDESAERYEYVKADRDDNPVFIYLGKINSQLATVWH